MLAKYARDWIVSIEDITAFVTEQHAVLQRDRAALVTPRERVYPVTGTTKLAVDA